jgi:RecG-like helicase
MLQRISFELIARAVKMWRTYKETDDSKARIIEQASRIHSMVIDAMRFHPDLKQLRELHEINQEVLKEYELAKRSGILPSNPRRTQTSP